MSAPEVAHVTRLIDQPRVDRYAEAARDPNPIHRDTAEAYAGPFGQPVAHGMLVLAVASDAMTRTFGTKWAESGALKVRWRSPALTPATVTARVTLRKDDGETATYDVTCLDGSGETLLTGTASVRYV